MYVPPAFRMVNDAQALSIIQSNPLGLLISQVDGQIIANHIPFRFHAGAGMGGVLRAHLARANTQWHGLDGQKVLVVFQGADAYISPQWYASKAQHGKVVPTWNYESVQVRGTARVTADRAWLLDQVTELTNAQEAEIGGGQAWQVADAPDDYIDVQLKGIVGLTIEVANINGKAKASQNRNASDREGVAAGLERQYGSAGMAGLVRREVP